MVYLKWASPNPIVVQVKKAVTKNWLPDVSQQLAIY